MTIDALTLLTTRRSLPALALGEPGPSADILKTMLTVAARVPDHGKLAPWRFVLFEGDARVTASDRLGRLFAEKNPDAPPQKKESEARVLAQAPLVVMVVSRAGPHVKIPEWEQVLSAGAVCLNLVHAAHALGFAANWLSGWAAYDADARRMLGLAPEEKVAGFIHIGTPPAGAPADRVRPEIDDLTTYWEG